jgi:hypothetical protein
MRITQIVQETTTSGSVATVAAPLFKQSRKGGNLLTGTKTKKKYANSISEGKMKELAMDLKSGKDGLTDEEFKKKYGVTKQEMRKSLGSKPEQVKEAEISEQDLILVPGQGRRMKPGFISKAADRTDREVEMALGDLFQAAKNAKMTYDMLKDISEDEGIEGWVQEKIIKASDYLNTIREYLENKRLQREGTMGAIAGGVAGAYLGKSPSAAITGAKIGSELQDTFTTEGKEELHAKLKEINHKIKMMRGGPVDQPNSAAFVEKRQALMKQKEEILAQLKQDAAHERKRSLQATRDFNRSRSSGMMEQGVAEGEGNKQKYEMMMRNGQVKKFIAKDDADAKRIAAGHGAKSVIKMKGNVPGGKIAEQGMAEGKIDFAKKLQQKIDKSNKAVVQTKKDIGHRIADIGPGGKEHNVKTNKTWDDANEGVMEDSNARTPDLSKIRTHKLEELLALQSEIGRKDPRTKASADLIRAELKKRGQNVGEGAKVDRMVNHVKHSEEKAGKSKQEAENIAWATANKRGMLNNKNKK